MKQKTHYALFLAFTAIIFISDVLYAQQVDLGVLQKQGPIGYQRSGKPTTTFHAFGQAGGIFSPP